MPDDSLPTVLRDLAQILDAELMHNPTASVEFPTDYVWPKGQDFWPKQKTAAPAVAPVAATPTPAAPAAPTAPAPAPAAPMVSAAPTVAVSGTFDELQARIAACTACPLSQTRTHAVAGEGSLQPDVLFIGEAPGPTEDAAGRPFADAAGELLTKMIAAMGYTREQVYIAYLVKCRPAELRPQPHEIAACLPHLEQQVAHIRPKTIVALGATVTQTLLRTQQGINSLRGRWALFQGIPLMPTYHPNYLLKMPSTKRDAWSDLKQVMAKIATLKAAN